jgi:hypothetical protein
MRNIIPTLMTLTTALFAQSDSSYRVTHTYTLGGDGSWDYVVPDPPQSPSVYRPADSRDGGR